MQAMAEAAGDDISGMVMTPVLLRTSYTAASLAVACANPPAA